MFYDVVIHVENLPEILAYYDRLPDVVDSELRLATTKSVLTVERIAKQIAPVGESAALSSSIFHTVSVAQGNVLGTVEEPMNYGVCVETGTEPHLVPIAPLKKWAAAVLGDAGLAYPVRKKIAREGTSAWAERTVGTRGYRFFERAADQAQSRIDAFYDDALANVVRQAGA